MDASVAGCVGRAVRFRIIVVSRAGAGFPAERFFAALCCAEFEYRIAGVLQVRSCLGRARRFLVAVDIDPVRLDGNADLAQSRAA